MATTPDPVRPRTRHTVLSPIAVDPAERGLPTADGTTRDGTTPDGAGAADLDLVVWDGGPLPPDDVLDAVTVLVPPYTFGPWSLDPLRRGLPHLRVVQSLTAGVEHLEAWVPDDVTLCNARGVHDASTAELAVGLAVASLRRLPEMVRAQDRHAWEHATHPTLADRRVVVVGWGSIGQAIGRRLAAFECEVVPVARTARSGVHGLDELPALLPTAEVLVLVVPLTEETRHLVDAEALAALPDGAVVVNVARGPVVDTDALLAELGSGRIRAALDVTDPEPLPADHPLWDAPGLLLTPHVGGDTTAFAPRARTLVTEQLRRLVRGEPLAHVVRGEALVC